MNWFLVLVLIACSGFIAYRFGGGALRSPVGAGGPGKSPAPSRSSHSASKIKTECLCVKSFEDVSALTAIAHDSDAESSLILNGRAVWMPGGTEITPFDSDKEVTTVLVKSGEHSGERCHLLAKFLE
jgi:hypothetical protein